MPCAGPGGYQKFTASPRRPSLALKLLYGQNWGAFVWNSSPLNAFEGVFCPTCSHCLLMEAKNGKTTHD